MESARHPLVLGAVTGYRSEQIELLVDSIKRSGFKGTTAFLVDRSNVVLQTYLAENGIESILIESTPSWMPAWFALRRLSGGRMTYLQSAVARIAPFIPGPLKTAYAVYWAGAFHHISNSRYFFCLQYLAANAHRFSHVLLTDTRDVVFQADPFEGAPDECLWIFQERDGETIGSSGFNRTMVGGAYGEKELEKIKDRQILCSGTTLGSTAMIIDYLRLVTKELVRITPQIHGAFGYDQGVLIWLYWNGFLPHAEVKRNFFGAVATLQLERPEELVYDDQDRLLNQDGRPVPILHQYNRHPSIVERVMAQHARKQA